MIQRRKESRAGERSPVKISRDFDFSRESVFDMFVDAKKAAKWWGPEGSVNLAFELDPRPGGAIKIDDRNPEGVVFRTSGTITEIVVPELLAFKSATVRGDGGVPFEALQTVTFEELSPKRTRVRALVSVLETGSWPGDTGSLEEGFKGGWGESFDRLARGLEAASEQGAVKVTRVFDFPRESVFKMWTDSKKLGEWWGPEGCVNVLSEVDPRPGGKLRVDQRSPKGDISSFEATFEKVLPPELLVLRAGSPGTSDEYGGFSAHETLETVTFEELGPRRTRVTVVTKVVAGPLEERESLVDAFREGWGQSLDKLQRALS